MPPPPLTHLLCRQEMVEFWNAAREAFVGHLVSHVGGTTAIEDVAGAEWDNAYVEALDDVWDESIPVESWEAHTLDPWPLPPYPAGL